MAVHKFSKENLFYALGIIVLALSSVLNYYLFHHKLNENGYEFVYIIYAVLFSGIFIFTMLMAANKFSIKIPFTFGYIKKLSPEEYEKITKETTEREKEKLFMTPEFQKMLQEKRDDETKWNWQLKDRLRGRRNIISDDELEDIDVSEDEN
jgi:hypothetical protein